MLCWWAKPSKALDAGPSVAPGHAGPAVTTAAVNAQRGLVVCPGVQAPAFATTLTYPDQLVTGIENQVQLGCARDCLYLVTLDDSAGRPVVAARGALRGGLVDAERPHDAQCRGALERPDEAHVAESGLGQVGARQHGFDTGLGTGRLGVDGHDACVRVGAANEGQVQRTGEVQVVGVGTLPCDQASIFAAADGLAGVHQAGVRRASRPMALTKACLISSGWPAWKMKSPSGRSGVPGVALWPGATRWYA